jgi:hypothetical protein
MDIYIGFLQERLYAVSKKNYQNIYLIYTAGILF